MKRSKRRQQSWRRTQRTRCDARDAATRAWTMQRAARQQATSGRTAHGRPRSPLSAAHARAAGYAPHSLRPLDRSIATDRPIAQRTNERRQPRVGGRLPRRAGACSARRAASARAPAAPDECCGAPRTATRRDTLRRTMLMLCSLSATNLSRQMRKFENAVFHCAPNPNARRRRWLLVLIGVLLLGRL